VICHGRTTKEPFGNYPQRWGWRMRFQIVIAALTVTTACAAFEMVPFGRTFEEQWPQTDFSKHLVPLSEIRDGGPPKDGIPSIENPRFAQLKDGEVLGWAAALTDRHPVIGLEIDGEARAYPLGIMIRHEIVNDSFDGRPVAVTYCPLCNAALVFDREVDGEVLEFGVTGLLRYADLIMYDRQSESWWQQYTGEAIVGARSGQRLEILPSRLEGFGTFRARHPNGKVLIPEDPERRSYLTNPYVGYDDPGGRPYFFRGPMPDGIEAMSRVVAVETDEGPQALSLSLVRVAGPIDLGGLRFSWTEGQSSALGSSDIAEAREIGNLVVQERSEDGWRDVPHHLVFAFAFHAFEPDAPIHTLDTWPRTD